MNGTLLQNTAGIVLETNAEWDGTECDGYCLQEDIDNWLLENFDKALSWDNDEDS